jgi:hypothetical protein
MNYFWILFILMSNSWGSDLLSSPPAFASDPIHLDYEKKIKELEKEYDDIKKSIDDARERIADLDFTPKVADLIKSELFTQEKYLTLIDQEISYFKLKDLGRKKYYSENSANLKADMIAQDLKNYQLSEKANPKKYIWRTRPPFALPPKENKKQNEKPKETEKPKH